MSGEMDVTYLKKLSKMDNSNVKRLQKELTIGVSKRPMQNIKSDVALQLNSRLHKYFEG